MKTILVEDDRLMLEMLECLIRELKEIEICGVFDTCREALTYAQEHEVELAILDIYMPGMDGIELGKRLREIHPEVLLIYNTSSEEHALQAYDLNAAAYLVKPFDKEKIAYALETASLLMKRNRKKIFARTFGYFDIFVDDKPVMFKSAKAKELLALLVDRQGGTVNTEQIVSVLWEDRPCDEATQNLCSKVVKSLQTELEEAGIGDILITNRGNRCLNTEKFDCDYYQMLAGNPNARTMFMGEYMAEYSWAEAHQAALLQM